MQLGGKGGLGVLQRDPARACEVPVTKHLPVGSLVGDQTISLGAMPGPDRLGVGPGFRLLDLSQTAALALMDGIDPVQQLSRMTDERNSLPE